MTTPNHDLTWFPGEGFLSGRSASVHGLVGVRIASRTTVHGLPFTAHAICTCTQILTYVADHVLASDADADVRSMLVRRATSEHLMHAEVAVWADRQWRVAQATSTPVEGEPESVTRARALKGKFDVELAANVAPLPDPRLRFPDPSRSVCGRPVVIDGTTVGRCNVRVHEGKHKHRGLHRIEARP